MGGPGGPAKERAVPPGVPPGERSPAPPSHSSGPSAPHRVGRKPFIAAGMIPQATALWLVAAGSTYWVWFMASALLGARTAMVYPTLLAAVADVAHPAWRGSAVGVYRLWRDSGYAFGAIVAGVLADAFGIAPAIVVGGVLAFLSGILVLGRMPETLPVSTTAASDAGRSPPSDSTPT